MDDHHFGKTEKATQALEDKVATFRLCFDATARGPGL
jgi:hypothetical protein